MKRFLPRTSNNTQGFTLIELLVVITIIAVLATIGISVFMGAQQNARDGKRIADISAIAKSLETSKDFTTGIYYNKLSSDFPNGIPTDPKREITRYCIFPHDGGAFSDDYVNRIRSNWSTDICPSFPDYTTWCEVSGSLQQLNGSPIEGDIKHWVLCAKKEGSGEIYCKRDLSP